MFKPFLVGILYREAKRLLNIQIINLDDCKFSYYTIHNT